MKKIAETEDITSLELNSEELKAIYNVISAVVDAYNQMDPIVANIEEEEILVLESTVRDFIKKEDIDKEKDSKTFVLTLYNPVECYLAMTFNAAYEHFELLDKNILKVSEDNLKQLFHQIADLVYN